MMCFTSQAVATVKLSWSQSCQNHYLEKNEQHSVMRLSCKKWLPLSETLYFQEFNEARFCHPLSAAVHVAQSCTSNKETQKSYRAFHLIWQHDVKSPCIDEDKELNERFEVSIQVNSSRGGGCVSKKLLICP